MYRKTYEAAVAQNHSEVLKIQSFVHLLKRQKESKVV